MDITRATVIGDLVGSRRSQDRRAVHDALTTALAATNARVAATSPLRVTAGDEFQGAYATLGGAFEAAFDVWLALADAGIDLRVGVGWGETTALDDAGIEDGPGWWAAREAIEGAATLQSKGATASTRFGFAVADGSPRLDHGAISAALHCRDHLLSLCDDRSRRILRGLMSDTAQIELAAELGISAQAVSRRVARDGLAVIATASALLAGLP